MLLRKLIPSISSKLIMLAFAGDILGVNVWSFWRMFLTVNLAEQIQSSEIIYRDIFLKGASSKLCQWHSLRDIINIYKLQNGNPSNCLSLKLILQIWSFLLLNFWRAECIEHLSRTPRDLSFQRDYVWLNVIIPVNSARKKHWLWKKLNIHLYFLVANPQERITGCIGMQERRCGVKLLATAWAAVITERFYASSVSLMMAATWGVLRSYFLSIRCNKEEGDFNTS